MPSFDVVNQIDLQEIDNAINNTKKAIDTRYDFRGSKTEVTFDRKTKVIHVSTTDTMKLQAVQEMLAQNLSKRGVSPKALDKKDHEPTSKGGVRQDMALKEGIDKEMAKKIVKMIKETKMKVQAQIQDEQVRVTGKKIDDLQEIIELLKGKNLDIPLQYVNMKS
ncbi:MAG: YajQ family cyclic di-GMP-binding protein [Candidatus Hydrogenedentota bacterium]|nr:MAG: YajQ family cyclic di-GMP-binding protein [Candidatus Hydrogenedentota bacterium]